LSFFGTAIILTEKLAHIVEVSLFKKEHSKLKFRHKGAILESLMPDLPQGICATASMMKPLAETAFDGLVMVSKTFIGVVAGVALVLSAWLLVILWTAPNEDGGAPSTSVVYPA
jgi:hypothetical protein